MRTFSTTFGISGALLALALLTGALLAGQASAESRTFIIQNNADGYGVDRCLANGERCGQVVATTIASRSRSRRRNRSARSSATRSPARCRPRQERLSGRELRQLRGDHEMRRAVDRRERRAGHARAEQRVGALHRGMAGAAAHDERREVDGRERRRPTAGSRRRWPSRRMLTGVVSTA